MKGKPPDRIQVVLNPFLCAYPNLVPFLSDCRGKKQYHLENSSGGGGVRSTLTCLKVRGNV